MNRREFGKRSAGMVAVGTLAAGSTGCFTHPIPPLEPKIGDKILVKYNYRPPFESHVIAIWSSCSWSSDGNAYHCYLPKCFNPHSKTRWCLCSRDQIEVLAKPEPKIGDKVLIRWSAFKDYPDGYPSEIKAIQREEWPNKTCVGYLCWHHDLGLCCFSASMIEVLA